MRWAAAALGLVTLIIVATAAPQFQSVERFVSGTANETFSWAVPSYSHVSHATADYPVDRDGAVTAVLPSTTRNAVWLFGGEATFYGLRNATCLMNDLWFYDLDCGQWSYSMGGGVVWDPRGSVATGWNFSCDATPYDPPLSIGATGKMPRPRKGAIMVTLNDTSVFQNYLYGGLSATGYMNDIWALTLTGWTFLYGEPTNGSYAGGTIGVNARAGVFSTLNYPGPRAFHTAWNTPADVVYIFGGKTVNTYGDVWAFRYNSSLNAVEWMMAYSILGTTPPSNANSASITAVGVEGSGYIGSRAYVASVIDGAIPTRVWIYGGAGYEFAVGDAVAKSELWSFNLLTNKWTFWNGSGNAGYGDILGPIDTLGATLPKAVVSPTLFAVAGQGMVYTTGGSVGPTNVRNAVLAFSPTTQSWAHVGGSGSTDITRFNLNVAGPIGLFAPLSQSNQVLKKVGGGMYPHGNAYTFVQVGGNLYNKTRSFYTLVPDVSLLSIGSMTTPTTLVLDETANLTASLAIVPSAARMPVQNIRAAVCSDTDYLEDLVASPMDAYVNNVTGLLNIQANIDSLGEGIEFPRYAMLSLYLVDSAFFYGPAPGSTPTYLTCTLGCTNCTRGGLSFPYFCHACDESVGYYVGDDPDLGYSSNTVHRGLGKCGLCPKDGHFLSQLFLADARYGYTDRIATVCQACSKACGNCTGPGQDVPGSCPQCAPGYNLISREGVDSCVECALFGFLPPANPANDPYCRVEGAPSRVYSGTYSFSHPSAFIRATAAPNTFDPEFYPPDRGSPAVWRDTRYTNLVWLFGGFLSADEDFQGGCYAGDMWVFDLNLHQWAYIKGPGYEVYNVTSESYTYYTTCTGVYSPGVRGVANVTNWPRARQEAYVGTPPNEPGIGYMYGGLIADGNMMNDIWRWDSLTRMWTWLSGNPNDGCQQAGEIGCNIVPGAYSTLNYMGWRRSYAMWAPPQGGVYLFGGDTVQPYNDVWSFRYNATLNDIEWRMEYSFLNPNPPYPTFPSYIEDAAGVEGCSYPASRRWISSTMDASAPERVWFFGGNGRRNLVYDTLDDLWSFNMTSHLWTWWWTGDYFESDELGELNVPGSGANPAATSDGFLFTFATQPHLVYLAGGGTPAGTRKNWFAFSTTDLTWTWIGGTGNHQPVVRVHSSYYNYDSSYFLDLPDRGVINGAYSIMTGIMARQCGIMVATGPYSSMMVGGRQGRIDRHHNNLPLESLLFDFSILTVTWTVRPSATSALNATFAAAPSIAVRALPSNYSAPVSGMVATVCVFNGTSCGAVGNVANVVNGVASFPLLRVTVPGRVTLAVSFGGGAQYDFPGTTSLTVACVVGCATCTAVGLQYPSQCTQCASGYGVVGGVCSVCTTGTYLIAARPPICVACTTGCAACTATGLTPAACQTCDTANGYTRASPTASCALPGASTATTNTTTSASASATATATTTATATATGTPGGDTTTTASTGDTSNAALGSGAAGSSSGSSGGVIAVAIIIPLVLIALGVGIAVVVVKKRAEAKRSKADPKFTDVAMTPIAPKDPAPAPAPDSPAPAPSPAEAPTPAAPAPAPTPAAAPEAASLA